ncbi:hypothetical protein GGS24DRAFT_463115 [Hypoxylon argillaceum]|nr:hypothetical protein GGS24DRAFT_463115 [Hypoxylon argillaceum]KAI1153904.1 hypothetical protein F4825DRAFT_413301 [Nemania diffusa]
MGRLVGKPGCKLVIVMLCWHRLRSSWVTAGVMKSGCQSVMSLCSLPHPDRRGRVLLETPDGKITEYLKGFI